jgi:HAD superfamily hydrolase (TIGR01509 family)
MINAIIFDMDGVISDTQKMQTSIESKLLMRYKIKISQKEITEKYAGVKTEEVFRNIFKENNIKADVNALIKEKAEIISVKLKKEIKAISGALKLIVELKDSNLLLGVSSSSPKEFVHKVLKKLKVKKYFTVITCGDEIKKGKPNPEIFLITAGKLKSNPKECLVIEDGISGMIAAKKAGMKCIGLIKKNDNRNFPADILVKRLKEINIDLIRTF